MKKLITTFALLLAGMHAFGQDITICHTPALDKFTLFASNSNFNTDHPSPREYVHVSAKGEMITYDTPDGKKANAFFLKAPGESSKYLLVIHEWWGLNDHIKREAEALFNDLGDVNVLAIDMYDGKVATSADEAGKLMGAMDNERGKNIVLGALEMAGDDARIGTIGWCFGGGWSLESSLLAGKNAAACVIYYGMPVNDTGRLAKLSAPVLGIFGSEDQWINPQVVDTFRKNMFEANRPVTIEMYEAPHAFANPSNPDYDQEATEDAYTKTLMFLKKEL